jgi:hypothetical protein
MCSLLMLAAHEHHHLPSKNAWLAAGWLLAGGGHT